MRADLQAILNIPPVSVGQVRDQKNMVLAWLYLQKYSPLVQLNPINMASKVSGLQGVSDDALLDLQIYGLNIALGLNQTWAQLQANARNAINGQGQIAASGLTQWVSAQNMQTLLNYTDLYIAGTISDAS